MICGRCLVLFFVLFLCLESFAIKSSQWRPVVLMHGLLASNEAMSHAANWIQQDFPGIYIANIEIGDGRSDSLMIGMNDQVAEFAAKVQNDSKLQGGFNLIGHSQGGLITRAYVERYNDPPVYNLISWAGPQMGQFGMPAVNAICPDQDALCDFFLDLMDLLMYGEWVDEWMQNHISFAAYWKDIFEYDLYLKFNTFLADINNEYDSKNNTYRSNLMSLNAYLLEYSTIDNIVIPMSSPWFEFFAIGEDTTVVPWNQTDLYVGDWIGTKTLYESKKLFMYAIDCDHQDIPRDVCKKYYDMYTKPLLNNTVTL